MRTLSIYEHSTISGGDIIAGYPSPDTVCSDIKLIVAASRSEPGMDITAATNALLKQCGGDFWTVEMAHQYVLVGSTP